MKNRYIKRTHISEKKFRELLKLFCADLTAKQISELMKIERKTVNRILQLLRERILELTEKESCFSSGEIEVDESYFGAKRVRGKRGRGSGGKRVCKKFCVKRFFISNYFNLSLNKTWSWEYITPQLGILVVHLRCRRWIPRNRLLTKASSSGKDGLFFVTFRRHRLKLSIGLVV